MNICQLFTSAPLQCHDNHHNWEELLEEWWAIEPEEGGERPAPLKQWLCDDKLKVCCPDGTFGPECAPCPVVDAQGRSSGDISATSLRYPELDFSCDSFLVKTTRYVNWVS